MTTAALQNFWNYIQGMNLSQRNKLWLADRLVESANVKKEQDLEERIKQGRDEIQSGKCVVCSTKEDLRSFLDSL